MATKYPPQISFSEAVRIIKDIIKTHKDREVSEDLLPDIYQVSRKSSYFSNINVALQKLGLVDRKPNGILRLTDLAMVIVNPIGDEDVEAKLTSAKKDEVLSALIEKYPNFNLPSAEQTKQTLIKLFNIERETVDKWYQFVIDSFRELSLKQTLNINVNETVRVNDGYNQDKTVSVQSAPKGMQNFELPSGKKFSFAIEEGFTIDDLDFIIDFITLKKNRLTK